MTVNLGQAESVPKKHRAETKRTEIVGLVRLIQLSTVGEVFRVFVGTGCAVSDGSYHKAFEKTCLP